MAKKGKQIGNAEERKIAKILSEWFFSDPNVLKRSADSGASKIPYYGDIVPVKQLIDFWPHSWPFMVEIKTGYAEHLPTFYNHTKVMTWINKAYKESQSSNQPIMMLITRFKHKRPLLFTNYYIQTQPFDLIVPLYLNDLICPIYVYKFYDITQYRYDYIFDMTQICSLKD